MVFLVGTSPKTKCEVLKGLLISGMTTTKGRKLRNLELCNSERF
jgi:hypothetical protein